MKDQAGGRAVAAKFSNPVFTADGALRASVALRNPQTLWFNTGSLCNIECVNCYLASSPTNDALVYISADEVSQYLDQLSMRAWPVTEIGFTGGEPFMNPEMIEMARRCLARGYKVLILTNAMRPMMRDAMRRGLLGLISTFGQRLTIRVSLDHWAA
ncbi:MAG: radical SAM protein, partial [Halocynthiibacter sp.]